MVFDSIAFVLVLVVVLVLEPKKLGIVILYDGATQQKLTSDVWVPNVISICVKKLSRK
jgi:hypothetical protein